MLTFLHLVLETALPNNAESEDISKLKLAHISMETRPINGSF